MPAAIANCWPVASVPAAAPAFCGATSVRETPISAGMTQPLPTPIARKSGARRAGSVAVPERVDVEQQAGQGDEREDEARR